VVSEQLEIKKDDLSEQVQKNKKKQKRGSSQPSFKDPTYDQLMTTVITLEGIVTTLTEIISSLQGTIGTLESRLLVLEGDARVSTLTQTVSSLQGTIDTLVSRLLALEGDARDFGVVSDGDIRAYMSLGPSYTSQRPSHTSPVSTAQKSLSLVNRSKLRPRRTPLKFKSPMIAYPHKFVRLTIPPPASTTTAPVMTMSVPMTTNEPSKDTIHTHLDALDAAQETGYTEDDWQFKRMEKRGKSNFDLLDLSKIKRKDKYLIYTTFKNNKTECYLDCLRKGMRCETRFWDILYPDRIKVDYIDHGKLEGYVVLAKIFDDAPQKMSKYGTLDYGVMTCKFIEMLTKGKTIDIEHFGDDVGLQCQEFRAKMALMLYDTRCERPV
ncbi:hypothetical protein Tco_1064429, partial [Tanacetum coccineum]